MDTATLLTSPLGQKTLEYRANKGAKRLKKYCSVAFEGILWVMVIVALALITAGGILNFIPTGIKYLNYPIGDFMNMPIGIYALVYVFLFIWLAIPFPLMQRNIPILNYYHRNFLIRGIVMAFLSVGLALTLATAVGEALLLLACAGYIVVYFLGFQPKFVLDEAERVENAEYHKIEGGEEIQLQTVDEVDVPEAGPEDNDEGSW